MSEVNFNSTTNQAVDTSSPQDLTNKTYNGVPLKSDGSGNEFPADDGTYKVIAASGVNGVQSGSNVTVDNSNPSLPVINLDDDIDLDSVTVGNSAAPVDGNKYKAYVNGDGDYVLEAVQDDGTTITDVITLFRTGSTIDAVQIRQVASLLNGLNVVGGLSSDSVTTQTLQSLSLDLESDTNELVALNPPAGLATGYDLTYPPAAPTFDSSVQVFNTAGASTFQRSQLRSNTVVVSSEDDLPTEAFVPALGYIAHTLDTDTVYEWPGAITLNYPCYVPSAGAALTARGVSIQGARFSSAITYTGTDPLFYCEGEFALEFMNVTTPNAYVVEWDATDANQSLVFQNGLYFSCLGLADVKGSQITTSLRLVTCFGMTNDAVIISVADAQQLNVTGGLFIDYAQSMFNTTGATAMEDILITSDNRFSSATPSSIAIELGNSLDTNGACIISGNVFNGLGDAISCDGAAANGDMVILGNAFETSGTILQGGISTTDVRVNSTGNKALRDSKSIGGMFYEVPYPGTQSMTLTTSVPEIIEGTFGAASNIERWSVIANPDDGTRFALQYDGDEDFEGFATLMMYGEETGAGTPDIRFTVTKNGTEVPPGAVVELTGNTTPFILKVPVTAATGDWFDGRIERLTGGNDWQIRTVLLEVS